MYEEMADSMSNYLPFKTAYITFYLLPLAGLNPFLNSFV